MGAIAEFYEELLGIICCLTGPAAVPDAYIFT